MIPAGFLGTRADLLVDVALTVFVVLPILLPLAFRLAKRGELHKHRTVQLILVATMTLAVLALEADIRLAGGSGAFAGRAVKQPFLSTRLLLMVHISIAATTWIGWLYMVVRSGRSFGQSLPGGFSDAHRRWGRRIWVGVCATAATGTLLYIATFVL